LPEVIGMGYTVSKSMKNSKNIRPLLLVGVLFISIVLLIILMITRIGNSYEQRIDTLEKPQSKTNMNIRTVKIVRKVTVHDENGQGCTEITQDGVVRKYSICGQQLETADRLKNPKNITKLFRKISERDWLEVSPSPSSRIVRVTFETDEGNQTYYLIIEDDDDQEIIDVLDDIEDDIPPSFPTPTGILQPTVAPSVNPLISPTPTQYIPPWAPTPTTQQSAQQPFLCGYTEDGKPTNISNTLCSTEPTPAQ